jgi:hypothetical protein
MNYYLYLIISLGANFVLMFCLFSPNIAKFIHRHHLDWKPIKTENTFKRNNDDGKLSGFAALVISMFFTVICCIVVMIHFHLNLPK